MILISARLNVWLSSMNWENHLKILNLGIFIVFKMQTLKFESALEKILSAAIFRILFTEKRIVS